MNAISTPLSAPAYEPQQERLGLLHRGIAIALMAILLVFLSVFVWQIEPKIGIFMAAFCFFFGGRRLLSPVIWPLIAMILYGTALNIFFPGPKPDLGLLITHPIYVLDCVLLAALALGGQSLRRQYALLLGILAISVVGAVGDWTGHDMTALLPFPLPDDDISSGLLLQQTGDVLRIRGFFTEAGVLAAVSIGSATMLALGAAVLIHLRARLQYAWIGLLGALTFGGVIVWITVTKSGFVMIAAGCVGFVGVLVCSRNSSYRMLAVAVLAALFLGGAAFLSFGPPMLTGYLRGEISAAVDPTGMTPDEVAGHSGTITRYKCWELAFLSVRKYPLGVGVYGLGSVIQDGQVSLNREMRYFFNRDNFGLKNGLANLIAQDGLVGVGLLAFWIFVSFLVPIRHLLADGSNDKILIAGIYGASALSSLVFLFSCELYPSFAFVLVLKFHADAIAQACLPETDEAPDEAMELIG